MKPQLAAQPTVLVPHIGRDIFAALDELLHLLGGGLVVGADGALELLDAQSRAVALGESHAVVLDVVGAAALDLGYLMRGSAQVRDHGTPVEVAVAYAGERAAALLRQLIQLRGKLGGGVPRIQRLLAGGDGVDTQLRADGEYLLKLRDRGACGDNADVGLELRHALLCRRRGLDRNADEGIAVANNLGDVLADVVLIAAECADNFSAVLKNVPHKVAAHLSRAVLNYSNFSFHDKTPP